MIPGYVVSEEIFRGRNRIVYRGARDDDPQPVIIKAPVAEHPSDADITRLKREFEIIRSLSHEGIVAAHGLVEDGNRVALILEDIGGKTLKTLIENGALDLTASLEIGVKLARSLASVHQKQIIHKDINPKNIVVDLDHGRVQLIDFSISSRLPKEDQKNSHPVFLEGTLAYMSPEQTGRMNRSIDYRTDFYSLGVTLYEMLTSRLPFETSDPMELVHCHIAKQPLSPSELGESIPDAVSSILMKLMAKTAEERYQSARGVEADLRACLRQWNATQRIVGLSPGAHDINDRFQIPQKLYGREDEIAVLLAGFERVALGSTEMLLVSGYSGIGKSALVREVDRPIAQRRGYFVSGKFDQLQRTVPYSAVVAAFRELIRQLLTESEEELEAWKSRLHSALGVNGQVVIDVLPEVELITGEQPSVAVLDPRQAENRFKLVFQRFIRVFCQEEHPLVIFLDDLQWADSASLKLIELTMTDDQTRFLYFIGAYRDNEVGEGHALVRTLATLRGEGANVHEISLSPLGAEHVAQLIGETFTRDDNDVSSLATLALRKTDGNPFFLRQFLRALHQEGFIRFDSELLSWRWELEKIETTDITNNVVDLMIRKLKKLPDSLRDVLRHAACIGNRFDLNSLSIIHEESPIGTARALWPAIQDGLVVPTSEYEAQVPGPDGAGAVTDAPKVTFRFLHDRVQQAAYTLIDASEKMRAHAKIGKLLLANLAEGEREERVFEIVDHCNVGRELLTGRDELVELAKLNLRAGIKAREATAYDASETYLRAGIGCLVGDGWESSYELALELHKNLAETEYLRGGFERSEEVIRRVLPQTRAALDRAELYNMLVVQHTLNGKYQDAIQTGRRALAELDIELADTDLDSVLESQIRTAQARLGDRKISSLVEARETTVAEVRLALKLLASVAPCAYIADPELCRVATLQMVNLSLEYGHTPESAFGYAFYGLVCSSHLKDYPSAYEFGRLAMKLSDRFDSPTQKCKVNHVFAAFINHWSRPLRLIQTINDEGFQAGLDSGELQFAGYHRYNRALCLFYMGRRLNDLVPELDELLQFSKRTRNQHATDPITAVQLVALNLSGQTTSRLSFQTLALGDAAFEADLVARKAIPALTHYDVMKTFALYLYGELEQARDHLDRSEARLPFVAGHFSTAAHTFYRALVLAAQYPRAADPSDRLAQLMPLHRQLERWAESSPDNFVHKSLLIGAEIARIAGRTWDAGELYDRAIDAANGNQFLQEQALANELAGKFYESQSRDTLARTYFSAARDLYREWGASAKVDHLEETHPRYLGEGRFDPTHTFTGTIANEVAVGRAKTLDMRTVIKAAQTISREIVLDTLLKKLIRIVIENAGAQKGALVLVKNGYMFVEAEGSVVDETISVSSAPIVVTDQSARLPLSIINYVTRTRENLLVPHAVEDTRFAGDAYVRDNQTRSVLCTPIANKGDLIGCLYLENNLVSGAFTPDRIEVVQILASQCGISLQNARLYDERRRMLREVKQLTSQLETRVHRRTEELSDANGLLANRNEDLRRRTAELEAVNKELESFAYAVSHDLRSPLRGIKGFSQMLAEDSGAVLDDQANHCVDVIQSECTRMSQIIEDLLALSKVSSGQLAYADVDLSELASSIAAHLREREPNRRVEFFFADNATVRGDSRLLKLALENLLGNAWKFTAKQPAARIELGKLDADGKTTYFVRDDGVGFDGTQAGRLFAPFCRLHSDDEFEGTGVGLATVRRIMHRHGGTVYADGEIERGATFYFTLNE